MMKILILEHIMDKNPYDILCSAHSKNFIVLFEKYSSLLTSIGLDLAIQIKNCLNNDKNSKSFGKYDDYSFNHFFI